MTSTPAHDPTYLGAAAQGYDEGYLAGQLDARRGVDDPDGSNPFTKLRDDRRAYVREQVTESFGSFYGPDDEDVFDVEDFVDAILDAHADWLAAQAAK